MKTAKLTLYKSDLLHDIAEIAYVSGDVMGGENINSKQQLQDITQKGNVNRINRVLDMAWSKCLKVLYPYVKESLTENVEYDNSYDDDSTKYEVTLKLSENISVTTVQELTLLVNEYMTAKALQDWMSIVDRERMIVWQEKAESSIDEIRKSLQGRIKPIRRKMTPF